MVNKAIRRGSPGSTIHVGQNIKTFICCMGHDSPYIQGGQGTKCRNPTTVRY